MSNKPLSVDQALAKADSFAKRGELNHARQLYNAVLSKFPGNKRASTALKMLGGSGPGQRPAAPGRAPTQQQINGLIALYNQGRLDRALELGAALAKQYPDLPLIHNILGAVNADSGRLDEAVASYTKALKLRPGYAEAHGNLGNALNALGRRDEAIASYSRALELKPDHAEAHNNLGNLLNDLGQHEQAVTSLSRAVQLRPGFAEAHNSLGNAFNALGRQDEAIASYERALELKPDYAEALSNLGSVLSDMGRNDEAYDSLTKALRIKPDYAEAHGNLGVVLAALGRNDEAISSYNKALELKPGYERVSFNLALAHQFEPGDPLIDELSRQLDRQPREGEGRGHLLSALGKAHDDTGDYGKAFDLYREANSERAREICHDPAGQRNWVTAIKAAFPEPLLCPDRAPMPVTPVFVVGMSCSGKTLVESLLARHPAVLGVGETHGLSRALGQVLDRNGIHPSFPNCLQALDPAQIRGVGQRYLDDIRHRLPPDVQAHVDTLPGNYSRVGLMFRAFPSVRVIYCRRDPLDHCLQVYFKLYASGHEYSYNLGHLASYYLGYREMMDHWLGLYGERILTVDYEDLVRDPQETGRKVYAYCGLDLPPGGFGAGFHTGQVGHARHYEAELAPLRKALGG